MKFPLLAVFLLGFLSLQGQEIKVVFSGVTVGNNAARISGAGIYFLQDQVTIASAKSDSKGFFVFSGSIYKKSPIVVLFSKPGYLPQRHYFDISKLEVPKKTLSITVKLVDTLTAELFPVNPQVSVNVDEKDYAVKYTWEENQGSCTVDYAYKSAYVSNIKQFIAKEEARQLMTKYKDKIREFEQVKDYVNALKYYDLALEQDKKFTLNDATLAPTKTRLDAGVVAQKKEQERQERIAKAFADGDAFLAQLKLKEAEIEYKKVAKDDPNSPKLKDKLATIAALKSEEAQRQNDWKTYARLNARFNKLYKVEKKYQLAMDEIKKATALTKLPKINADSTSMKVQWCTVALQEANLDKEINETLKASEKLKGNSSKKILGDSKGFISNLEKLDNLIVNISDNNRKTSAHGQTDKVISSFVDVEISNAYDLQALGNYDKAIEVYNQIKSVIAFAYDQTYKNSKLLDIEQKVAEAKKNQQNDIAKFQQAIKTATDALDAATFSYSATPNYKARMTEVKNLLAQNPLKIKAAQPEVVQLNQRFLKVSQYFTDNAVKLKSLKNPDPTQAIKIASELVVNANAAGVGKMELMFLQSTSDSIRAKLPKTVTQSQNMVRSTVIKPPKGYTAVNGNVQTAVNDINLSISLAKQRADKIMEDRQSKAELTRTETAELNDVAHNTFRDRMDKEVTVRDTMRLVEVSKNKDRELSNINVTDRNTYEKEVRNVNNAVMSEKAADLTVSVKDQIDSNVRATHDQNNSAYEKNRQFSDAKADYRDLERAKEQGVNKERETGQRVVYSDYDAQKIANNQEAQNQSKDHQKLQEKRADYVDERTNLPNYMKDSLGNCLPWNHMSEFQYQLTDEQGFTSSIIIQRVVVNANGYGVIYEQTINSKGISSYALNGESIPESVWSHDSTGESFFQPGGSIQPTSCP